MADNQGPQRPNNPFDPPTQDFPPQNPNNRWQQQQNQWQQPPQYQQQYQQQPPQKNSDSGKTALIIAVIALLLVIAVGAIGIMNGWFGGSSDDDDNQEEFVTETVIETEVPEADSNDSNSNREERDEPESTGGDPNRYRSYDAGTSVTSDSFASNVHSAFRNRYLSTGDVNMSINVYSPVTGQTYTMNCGRQGSSVACRGGNNAVVYIY